MFYQGVVEDVKDPMKLGRVRVRIIGLHSDNRTSPNDKDYMPTEHLPWAEAAGPIGSPAISGSSSFAIPLQGSLIWLFFKDSQQQQYPVYFATAVRIAKEQPDFSAGFSDPAKVYPKADSLNESPLSRIARNESIEKTSVHTKQTTLDSFQVGNTTIQEPVTKYDAQYPNNKVIETPSGHVIEIDDTPGKERLSVWHKSGSFIEMHPDGVVVNKIKNRSVTIIHANGDVHIMGDHNIKVDGTANISVGVDAIVGIGRDAFVSVGRDTGLTGSGNASCNVGGNCRINASRIDLNPGR